MGVFVSGQTAAMLISMTGGIYVVKLIGNAYSILLGALFSAVMCTCAAPIPPLLTGSAMGVVMLTYSLARLGDGLLQVLQTP